MNVLIIEDEPLTASRLFKLIERYDPSIRVMAKIASVAEALSWFSTHPASSVDLIFMDIHLEDGDSFQILSKLQLKTPIIFTTAFDDYMIRAFKVNSVDYLLKPINHQELASALNKFKSDGFGRGAVSSTMPAEIEALMKGLSRPHQPQYKERFMVTVGTKIRSVGIESVAYFYLEERAVLLVMTDGTVLPLDYSLDRLMHVIDPKQFFRVSRQFIVSLQSIQTVRTLPPGKLRLELVPKAKQEVTVSGDRVADFKGWLGKD